MQFYMQNFVQLPAFLCIENGNQNDFIYRIYHTIILDDPYDDPPGLEVPDRSPEPTKEQLDVNVFLWLFVRFS